jgi:alkylation response protein AidB-like acyl-CoA dehydrogenase
MDFDLSEDQREIQATARGLLAARCGPAAVRAAAEARSEDAALWEEVSRLGWPGIAIAEQHGGQGLGLVELCVVLEQAGAALAPIPLLPSAGAALMISKAGSAAQRERLLPGLAAGRLRGAVGLRDGDGSACLLAGPARPAADAEAIVLADLDGGASLLHRSQASLAPLQSIDPLRSYFEAQGEGEPLPGDCEGAALAVAVAVAAECVGVCQRALEITVSYVKERKQFGVPVGSFQAVSHRCAEMLLHTEQARSAVYHAAWAGDADPQRMRVAASLAKALAGEAALDVTASAIQAHGGIGFTWEADVHWLYKRAQLNAQLMGGAAAHRRRLARALGIAPGSGSPPRGDGRAAAGEPSLPA